MRRWCWSTSCARPSRTRSCSPRSACARACSIRCSSAEERKQDALHRRGARPQPAALALAAPRRGTDRLDRHLHGVVRASTRTPRRSGCATPPACWPISAGARIRTIAASSRSTSSRTPAFVGIDHPGRAYLALSVFFRHVGLLHDEELSPRIRELASTRMLDRARVLGAAMRVAYMVSASQPGVLPRSPLKVRAASPGAAPRAAIARRWPATA